MVGYLGYDVVREVERLPGAPPDEAGYPDAILSVVGQLAAYDYWRQRVTLLDSVPIPPAAAGNRAACDALYDAALIRLDALAAEGADPLDEPLLTPPERDDEVPPVRRRTPPDLYAKAVEVAKDYILAGDIFQVASPSASSSSSTQTPSICTGPCDRSIPAPTCTSCATPSCASWDRHRSRSSSSPRPGGLPPIAGTRRRGAPTARPAAGR